MAVGSYDAQGIWRPGEDDAYPTFSARLDKIAQSVSAVVIKLRDRLRALEGRSGWVTLPIVSPFTTLSGVRTEYRLTPTHLEFRGRITTSGGVGSNNTHTASIPSAAASRMPQSWVQELMTADGTVACRWEVTTAGQLRTSVVPSSGRPSWIALDGLRIALDPPAES